MTDHAAAPQWIKLKPEDDNPLDGFGSLRFGLSNPHIVRPVGNNTVDGILSNYYRAHMRPRGFSTYSGRVCREWIFDWYAKDLPMRDSICIGISDHLPYHLTLSGGASQATYEWNRSISIEPPKTVPRPEHFTVWPPDPASH